MKTEFVKWGNSLALRIPATFAKEVGASEGKTAEMTVEDDALIVKVTRPRRRRPYSLGELLEGITPEDYHPEVEWGPPVGNEVW
jgi:antitoxin MazE